MVGLPTTLYTFNGVNVGGTGVLVAGRDVMLFSEVKTEKSVLPAANRRAHRVIIISVRLVNSIIRDKRFLEGFVGSG